MIRIDHDDHVYMTERGKLRAVIQDIKESYEKGQPVLVGTVTVEKSEILSELLKREGIKHNVLNAKYHAKEAEIVAQAGQYKAVTIATNMAGRVTDIMLGGNTEALSKQELRHRGYDEATIMDADRLNDTEDEEILKVLLLDRGELLTYKPKYLSEKLSFLIENGLKEKIVKILIEEIEIFDEENENIDLEYLKKL